MGLQINRLKREADALQKIHGGTGLCPVYGAGCVSRPDAMFLFMNPTGRNISSAPDWRGVRAPWLGTKNVWRLFFETGFIEESLFLKITSGGKEIWTTVFAESLYAAISSKSLYVTNLAKCTQEDARPIKNSVFKSYLGNTLDEIAAVSPKRIISFGNQVSSILLDRRINVSSYAGKDREIVLIKGRSFDVFPVFYPVGQGMRNMSRAIERIRTITSNS